MKVHLLSKESIPAFYILIWWILLTIALIFKWDSWPVSSFPMFTNTQDVVVYSLNANCAEENKEIFLSTKLHRYFLYKYLAGQKDYLKKYIRMEYCHLPNDCRVDLLRGNEKNVVERISLSEVCQ